MQKLGLRTGWWGRLGLLIFFLIGEASNGFAEVRPSNMFPPFPITPTPAHVSKRTYKTAAMIYNGVAAWGAEVASLEEILDNHGVSYQEVSSYDLNSMSVDELAQFGMIVWPGGYADEQAESLTDEAHARLREAVQVRGLNWIGFCAGAFVAEAPKPPAGQDVSYGIGVIFGPILDYYYLENQGYDAAMTMETFADGSKRDLVWYGGPVTPNNPGTVVAKYPNGDPAMSQLWSGNGFVFLSGVHPAAPQSIRDTFGLDDVDGLDFDLAWKLLDATLNSQPLPVFK